jgi:signal transduction histidine kinase
MSEGGPEQVDLAAQVAILKDQLAQAQKLTALGELISTTTHEYNNVLMTIINYAKLGMRHPDAATAARSFDKILTAANRAARITNGILGFARNRSASFEPTDMVKLIDDTLLLVEREMTKYRVKVERRILPAPPALANTNQIQQVLLNLVVNARQAMPQGGVILVQLSHDAATDSVDLMVRDNGTGMTPETMRRIFEPFYSTKQGPDATGKGGAGLGLSSCRDIIEAHHGKIKVQSELGKGTAFTIRLPAARVESPTAPAPANVAPPHLPVAMPQTPTTTV